MCCARNIARRIGTAVAAAIVVIAMAVPALAQVTTGGVRGIVRDDTGGILVGVTVQAESPDRIGAPAVDVTNDQGLYRFDRFPAGVYTVEFTLQGFRTIRREGIRVEVGRATQLDVTLGVATTAETVTVTGESPVTDATNSSYGTNLNQELVANIPTVRGSYYDVIQAVPGVTGGANFSYFGSNADQNSYQINGVDVSAPDYGKSWAFPNYDIVKEIEVVGIGASAEHTGFQGGIVNVVTKSGSNQLRGQGTLFATTDGMVGNNRPEEAFPPRIDYNIDATGELGGPIVKDKLWVIALVQSWNRRQVPIGVELIPDVQPCREWRTFYKADAQLGSGDTLAFHFDNNNFKCANTPSRFQPIEATATEHGHNPVFSVNWTHTLGPSTLLEVRGGGLYIRDRFDPTLENYRDSQRQDVETGYTLVNSDGVWQSVQDKSQVSASVSHSANDFIKGAHDLKAGVQVSFSTAKTFEAYHNNTLFYDFDGDPFYLDTREPTAVAGTINTAGLFVQDNWALTDRLTLNLGVRFDRTTGSIPSVGQRDSRVENETGVTFDGIPDLVAWNNVSPRLGFALKLDKVGKTVLKMSAGRYYGKLVANMFNTLSPGNTIIESYNYNPVTGRYDDLFDSVNFNENFAIDPKLRNQYTDALMVGLERELIPDFGVKLMFVQKNEADFIRVRDEGGTYVPVTFVDPFDGRALTAFNRVSPASASLYTVTNRQDLDQSYRSIVIEGVKRWSQGWQMDASYQWQDAEGYSMSRGSGALQDASGLDQRSFGSDPNDLINAYGKLGSGIRHIVKVSGSYEAPWGLQIGSRFTFDDGRPFGRVIRVTGLRQGVRNVFAQPSGAYELDNRYDLQLRVTKDFRFGGSKRLRLSVDVFNLLNKATATSIRNNSSQSNFLVPTATVYPRYAMLGARFEF